VTSTARLIRPISKEVRALTLPWLACTAAMIVPAIVDPRLFPEGLFAAPVTYVLGAAALGALSIGREYSDRTLSALLALPARRERLLLVKLGVLAAMLLALWLVADVLVFRDPLMPRSEKLVATALPALCALFLAPWLTMACRNAIAGAVFTTAIAAVLFVVGERLGVASLWRTTLGACAIGAVMNWWMFVRLEAIEGPWQDVRLPRWLAWTTNTAAPSLTKRNPIWLLAKKELRLQQLALAVAGLYLLGSLALAPVELLAPYVGDSVITFSYVCLLAFLIGSFGSAGERELGTLEWQVLQPVPISTQWAIKMGVVSGLMLLLALGVPALIAYVVAGQIPSLAPELAAVAVLLTAGSLYVSSLCRSGLWALLMSIPATFGAMLFFGIAIMRRVAGPGDWSRMNSGAARLLSLLLIAAFIAVLLRFALSNHRSAEPAAARAWKQLLLIAAVVTAEVMILEAFYRS
jgi:hypothetical protein